VKRLFSWFGSLKAQFALLLILALVIANIATLFVIGFARDREFRILQRFAEIERLTTIMPVIDSLAPELRDDLVRAASSRRFSISLDSFPMVEKALMDEDASLINAFIKERLDISDPDTLRVQVISRRDSADVRNQGNLRERRRGQGVLISIQLSDGMWLNTRQARPPRGPRFFSQPVLLVLLLTFITVLAVGLWFIHRLTKPLKALGEAALKAGHGDRSARLEEVGATEIRDTARAFNAMQSDINAFETERARTIAAVGHDLRTPITSLRLRTEMVEDDNLRQPMIETLDTMQVMADELLSWGRANAVEEEKKEVDLPAMLNDVCSGTSVHFVPDDAVSIKVRPVALRRVLSNLVQNAHRYGGGGTASIKGSAETATITIQDDGPGIPDKDLEIIFKPFARGETSRSSETGGYGLGLSIVRSIVRSHGGEVTLQNKKGSTGLIATITLPR